VEDNWEDRADEEEVDSEEEAEAEVEEDGRDYLVTLSRFRRQEAETLSRFRRQEAEIKELKQQVNQLALTVAELLKRASQTS
jgi:hypothetical protein